MKLPDIVRQGLLHRCTLERDSSAGWYHISDEYVDDIIVFVQLVTGTPKSDFIADYRMTFPLPNVLRRNLHIPQGKFLGSVNAEDGSRVQIDIVGLSRLIQGRN